MRVEPPVYDMGLASTPNEIKPKMKIVNLIPMGGMVYRCAASVKPLSLRDYCSGSENKMKSFSTLLGMRIRDLTGF